MPKRKAPAPLDWNQFGSTLRTQSPPPEPLFVARRDDPQEMETLVRVFSAEKLEQFRVETRPTDEKVRNYLGPDADIILALSSGAFALKRMGPEVPGAVRPTSADQAAAFEEQRRKLWDRRFMERVERELEAAQGEKPDA